MKTTRAETRTARTTHGCSNHARTTHTNVPRGTTQDPKKKVSPVQRRPIVVPSLFRAPRSTSASHGKPIPRAGGRSASADSQRRVVVVPPVVSPRGDHRSLLTLSGRSMRIPFVSWAAGSVSHLLGMFLIPEGFGLDYSGVPAFVFAYFYIPLMALMLCFTANGVLKVVFTMVFPFLNEGRENEGSSLVKVVALAWHLVPYFALLVCFVICCYKGVTCIAESMVDAFRREVRDGGPRSGMAYGVLAHRLQRIASSNGRLVVFLVVLSVSLSLFSLHAWSNLVMVWGSRDYEVLLCSWIVFVSQGAYFLAALYVQPHWSIKLTFDTYWQKFIPKTRRNIVYILIIFVVRWVCYHSLTQTIPWVIETMLYLVSPHVFLSMILSLVRTVLQTVEALAWVNGNRTAIVELLLGSSVPCVLLVSMVIHFWTVYVAAIGAYVACLVVVRVVSVHSHPHHHAHSPRRVPPAVWMCYGARGVFFERWEAMPRAQSAVVEAAYWRDPKAASFALDERWACDLSRGVIFSSDECLAIKRSATHTSWLRGVLGTALTLVLMQSAPQPNHAMRYARTVSKGLMGILVFLLMSLVSATILQTTVQQLRPVSIHVSSAAPADLRVEHFVVDMRVTAGGKGGGGGRGRGSEPPPTHPEDEPPIEGGGGGSGRGSMRSPSRAPDEYGVCDREWYGLHAMDYAWMSMLSYMDTDTKDLADAFGYYCRHFSGASGWTLVNGPQSSGAVGHWVVFHDFYDPTRNLTVIAVRGTDLFSARDMLQDVQMYVEVGLYQFLSFLIPGMSLLPTDLIVDYIKFASLDLFDTTEVPSDFQRHYWTHVTEYTAGVIARRGGDVVITGHSLGGAIANIAAASLGVRAVTMSSPGLLLSHKKFGVPLGALYRNVNVVPRHDVVPKVDYVVGEVHHIQCNAKRKDVCHGIEFTVMELWRSCGSIRRRTAITAMHGME